MNFLNKYQKFCKTTANTKFATKEEEILCWGCGISGEAGDIASCIKKTFIHKNDQTRGIRENIGDTMWYIVTICNFFNWNLNEILKENIEKLKKRYPKGFTYKDAKRKNTMMDWGEK